MLDTKLPDLSFPDLAYGSRQEPIDLRWWLYRGGASAKVAEVHSLVERGELGSAVAERIELLKLLHAKLRADFVGGRSEETLRGAVYALRTYYQHADSRQRDPNLANAADLFVSFAASRKVAQRNNLVLPDTVYQTATLVARHLAIALGLPDQKYAGRPLLLKAGIRLPKRSKRALGTEADKQNLEETFKFGRALVDICNSLSLEAVLSPLPIPVRYSSGQVHLEWCGLTPEQNLQSRKKLGEAWQPSKERLARTNDCGLNVRYSVINLRLEAEMMVFVAQTGMNLAQVVELEVGDFRYESYVDGYTVRRYKNRRLGEVEFQIFKEYRPWFERYLTWRKEIFAKTESTLLFPFLAMPGMSWESRGSHYQSLERALRRMSDVTLIKAQKLRNTRVNWLIRKAGDLQVVADMDQHSQSVLIGTYEKPHHQRAAVEATRFWREMDPSMRSAPAPGGCVTNNPELIPDSPSDAPVPDCEGASGCLFCVHHRDKDTFDHVWNLASLRFLKSHEVAKQPGGPSGKSLNPALRVVERITAKLAWYNSAGKERLQWVQEAEARVKEGRYHIRWAGFIRLSELST